MIAIGVAHLAFLDPDLRPADGRDTGWIPLVGDVPILWMVLAWEFPTAALILGGLISHRRMPRLAGAAVAVGAISYSIHLWYFVIVPVLTVFVIATVVVRSLRLVAQQSATSFVGGGAR